MAVSKKLCINETRNNSKLTAENNYSSTPITKSQTYLSKFLHTIAAIVVVLFIFHCISGQTWNQMRRPGSYYKRQQVFNPSARAQSVSESYVIGLIYLLITCGFVALNCDFKWKNERLITIMFVVGALVTVAINFGIILGFLKYKRRSYPYAYSIM